MVADSSDRTLITGPPSGRTSKYARERPSGEIAPMGRMPAAGWTGIWNRIGWPLVAERDLPYHTPTAIAAIAMTAATLQSHVCRVDFGMTLGTKEMARSRAALRSSAFCQRSLASFERHFFSTRSNTGGATASIEGAGRSITAAITLAALV